MKTIYLLRHAESELENANNDFDRNLTMTGIRDAELISNKLDSIPDLIISSPAVRTTRSSVIFAHSLKYPIDKIDFEETIYEAPVKNLINKINKIDASYNTVLLVGHNPGITQLVNYLVNDTISQVQPCTIIKIDLEIDNWNEIIIGIGSIKQFIDPSH